MLDCHSRGASEKNWSGINYIQARRSQPVEKECRKMNTKLGDNNSL